MKGMSEPSGDVQVRAVEPSAEEVNKTGTPAATALVVSDDEDDTDGESGPQSPSTLISWVKQFKQPWIGV